MSFAQFATPAVLKALRQKLLATHALASKLGRGSVLPETAAIYTEAAVPASATTGEYLTIGPFSEVPRDTMGDGLKWGSELTVAIKIVSYSPDPAPGYALVEEVVGLLHGQSLDVEGYRTGWVQLDLVPDQYRELVAGVPVSHFPMIFRVHVHES